MFPTTMYLLRPSMKVALAEATTFPNWPAISESIAHIVKVFEKNRYLKHNGVLTDCLTV